MPELNLTIFKQGHGFKAELKGHNKFYGDAFKKENEEFFLMLNGVNFQFHSTDLNLNFEKCISDYKTYGDEFFSAYRGSFSGALLDKRTGKWVIFTNHMGDQKLFYYISERKIIISSSIFTIKDQLKEDKKVLTLNKDAAYLLLTKGYMAEDQTIANEIKRLTAGNYLYIEKDNEYLKTYYKIDNTPNKSYSENDLIERLDNLFRNAVKQEFDKDLLYGYEHIASMSGGLDSRMTSWVAHDIGYKDIINITYSQYGYLDMTIAQKISSYLGYSWLYKALDRYNVLKDIDANVHLGNALYHWGAIAMNKYVAPHLVDHDGFGLLHTGQLGDVTLGTYTPTNAYGPPRNIKSISSFLASNVTLNLDSYQNHEMANYYIRGLNGILTGNFVYQEYTEVASPFLDIDFIDFCMSIPVESRRYHNIYKKWILKKYPKAARFKWEGMDAKITDPKVVVRGKLIPVRKLARFFVEGILHHMNKPINNTYSSFHMNPYNYWYRNNQLLRDYFNRYFKDHIDLIKDNELKRDCEMQFSRDNAIEKMQVLTIISAIKQLEIE